MIIHFDFVSQLPQNLIFSPKPILNPKPNPQFLNCSDSGLLFRSKILYLQSLNVNPTKALELNPHLRSTPLKSFQSVENCLSSFGLEKFELGRILDMYPTLLTCEPYSDLYPVLDFLLNDVEIPYPAVRKAVNRCPRLLVRDVETQLRPTLWFLRKIGFVGSNSISCQTTLLLVSSVNETLMPKLEYLMSLGFEYAEVVSMVLRSPALLTYSIENNFKPKVEYFLEEMNGDVVEFKRFPQYFSFSLERKIKWRHQLLSKHCLSLPLSEMLKPSDGEFSARLIEWRLRYGIKNQVKESVDRTLTDCQMQKIKVDVHQVIYRARTLRLLQCC
ncbi:transcription termination factor MTEF1, chloroplastic [Heracleum sosnowskyi]|uniref:Transcription termination factor MTEF1, chloroplastic n=1 Tax=Heracleum sosnowskyi TaxID=360622 RepID=A0AAD8MNF0_9APIA|nr:transcription termination factor MTEF1, chloroplastic [Heracleum sosnowskyi]